MLLVLASNEDKNARALVARLGSEQAALVGCDDLCQPGWRFSITDPDGGRVVAGGEVKPLSAITGVLTCRPCVFEVELMNVAAEDRYYVAAEVNSFLIAWLSSLRCPVINRPVGNCLSGPSWHPEEWVSLAASIGIPVRNVRRVARLNSRLRRQTDSDSEKMTSLVTVVGERWFGEVDNDRGAKAVRLARAAGVDLLLVRFEKENFAGASALPPLNQERVINAVLQHLERLRS
jgi:hypothetical protein